MTLDTLKSDTNAVVAAKKQLLQERQTKTPSAAVIALADMQKLPAPVLNIVTGGNSVTVIGQITYTDPYDPVGAALRYARSGVDALAFFTDDQIYSEGLDDLLLVARAVRHPVILQDYILNEYHVAEARAAGAAALTLYASVLDPVMLRRTVSLTQRWRMTAIVQIDTLEQLQIARQLSPHVLSVGDPRQNSAAEDLRILAEMRPYIPYNIKVKLHFAFTSVDEVTTALRLGVDAIVVTEALVDKPAKVSRLYQLIHETTS